MLTLNGSLGFVSSDTVRMLQAFARGVGSQCLTFEIHW